MVDVVEVADVEEVVHVVEMVDVVPFVDAAMLPLDNKIVMDYLPVSHHPRYYICF